MLICPDCQAKNSVDSQFCKSCGKAIPADVAGEAKKKLDELEAEGYKALNEGRSGEAILIAENVLSEAPESLSALSLKGMSLEREGRLTEALETYEKVVGLNPDSALDRIKVQHLRNSLTAQTLYAPEPDRPRAMLAAVAATVLVLSIGAIGAMYLNPGIKKGPDVAQKEATGSNSVPQGFPLNAGGADTGKKEATDTGTTGGATGQANGTTTGGVPNPGPLTRPSGTGLPNVDGTGGGNFPVRPEITIEPTGNTTGGGNGGTTGGGTNPGKGPDEIDPGVDGGKKPNETKPTENPGIINIQVSGGPKTSDGGSKPVDGNGGGLTALLAAARDQMMLGKYDQAAQSYNRALNMGGDAAMINQRLGQCYRNLGKTSEAVTAFRNAITAIEGRISRGGDAAKLQPQLDACKQELKLLGG